MPDARIALFAHADVGERFLAHLARRYPQDIALVVVQEGGGAAKLAQEHGLPVHVDAGGPPDDALRDALARCTVGLLCWWPRLLPPELLQLPRHGFVNTHPSLLPHNRGKHPNFWSIVERRPFGVTLHEVTAGVDAGAVIAHKPLAVGWEDTGATLHERARTAMFELLVETYPNLRTGAWTSSPQRLEQGSFHLARELDPASVIDLDRHYSARDLLNLLRARTYQGHPACRFEDDGTAYEVRIDIKRIRTP